VGVGKNGWVAFPSLSGVGACVVELWEALKGLKYVRRLGFCRVELHIDSIGSKISYE
jgi:hypothetical protein